MGEGLGGAKPFGGKCVREGEEGRQTGTSCDGDSGIAAAAVAARVTTRCFLHCSRTMVVWWCSGRSGGEVELGRRDKRRRFGGKQAAGIANQRGGLGDGAGMIGEEGALAARTNGYGCVVLLVLFLLFRKFLKGQRENDAYDRRSFNYSWVALCDSFL